MGAIRFGRHVDKLWKLLQALKARKDKAQVVVSAANEGLGCLRNEIEA